MGIRQSKLHEFCQKALQKRKKGKWASTTDGEEMLLLDFGSSAGEREEGGCPLSNELARMQAELDRAVGNLKTQLERLNADQRRKLDHNARKLMRGTVGKRRIESMVQECRLRTVLLAEKCRNCVDHLQGFEALIRSIQKEEWKESDDNFLREFLVKTARRQQRKGQLGKAVDSLCQLLIATDGRLYSEEMGLLTEICREKIRHTREFYERISNAVMQQIADSPMAANSYVEEELWGSVLEDLRLECAEAYEIVMRVRTSGGMGQNGGSRRNRRKREKEMREGEREAEGVARTKYLMGATICALWLQITPNGHEEVDEVKELLFSTLDQYIGTFVECDKNETGAGENTETGMEMKRTMCELLAQYPKLASTKKMRRIMQRIVCPCSPGEQLSAIMQKGTE